MLLTVSIFGAVKLWLMMVMMDVRLMDVSSKFSGSLHTQCAEIQYCDAVQYNFIARCQDCCIRNVSGCQVRSHIHTDHNSTEL